MIPKEYTIILFIISCEYLLFFFYLLAKSYRHVLKTKLSSNKFLYFLLIETYCIFRFFFEISYAIGLDKISIGIVFGFTYLLSYSALSVISLSWSKISIRNSFEISFQEKILTYYRFRYVILIVNVMTWIIFIVLAIAYVLFDIPDISNDYIPWIFRLYEGFLTVVILILLLFCGVKLLRIIYKFSNVKPRRLLGLIYIALIAFLIKSVTVIIMLFSPTIYGTLERYPEA